VEVPCKTSRARIAVLIADANEMACHLLASLLKRHRDLEVVACATNAESLLESVTNANADIALVAASLDDGRLSGLAAVQQIRSANPQLRAVLLLDHPDRYLVVEALRAGVRGVFSRSHFDSAKLCKCVRKVYEGQIWINTNELEYVLTAFSQMRGLQVVDFAGLDLLTNREEAVMRLVAEGLGNREIAQKLNLSEHTVKNYLFHIFDKLGISNRVELVLYAVSNPRKIQPGTEQMTESLARAVHSST
jgi:DNA-binding NarL/FixJ family response regulator